ncbi:phospholipase D-like domain-containing protein [Candidatus Symbiopectobacterium sp. NZEC135]|uniref:phospholipase D-like domain-containing protein n=1 Tax=Candidatus Symbiopectobacterium sp. NZEC135 TaxID=2820471 RepID=UPI0022274E46|nr:phospholipase D-like domain-containing protein [Candidatus Symbiopectobacterium sp. NZEC135]MCW2478131.1 hypothetical protein [Candidatus Symbiopectobacterium sp. NZEC135]
MKYIIETQCHFKDIEQHIKKQLQNATNSIKICVSWINIKIFERILLDRINQGVKVYILANDDFSNTRFYEESSPIIKNCFHRVTNPIRSKLMHNKFCIIDDEILISGSYNWSNNANYHYENIIIIKNDFQLIKEFKHQFSDLMHMATMPLRNFNSFSVRKNMPDFKLGTISTSRGILEVSTLQVWSINLNKNTFSQLAEMDVPNFISSIDYDEPYDYYNDKKEYYNELFELERSKSNRIQKYFQSSFFEVNAIGSAYIANANEHIEYGEEIEKEISLSWIDIRLRNVLPSTINADDEFSSLWDEIYY